MVKAWRTDVATSRLAASQDVDDVGVAHETLVAEEKLNSRVDRI